MATTDWYMISYSTIRIDAASSWARIDATIVNATLVTRTISVEDAFRSTRCVRIADVIGWANAIDSPVLFLTLSVSTARIGITWSRRFNDVRFDYEIIQSFSFTVEKDKQRSIENLGVREINLKIVSLYSIA